MSCLRVLETRSRVVNTLLRVLDTRSRVFDTRSRGLDVCSRVMKTRVRVFDTRSWSSDVEAPDPRLLMCPIRKLCSLNRSRGSKRHFPDAESTPKSLEPPDRTLLVRRSPVASGHSLLTFAAVERD